MTIKFHNIYSGIGGNKKDYPNCPRCKSNVNVVKQVVGFRCAFCDSKFVGKEGQQTLKIA